MIGEGILFAAVIIAILGSLCNMVSRRAFEEDLYNDGIGGKDTDNLATGCFGAILSIALYFIASVLGVVGLVVLIVEALA